jgi:GNAT superfamily N-acetyltransferase
MNLKFRKIKVSDYRAIKDIMSEIWHLDEDVEDRRSLAFYENAYLYFYLGNSNYYEVAVADGKVVGYLMGRCDYVKTGAAHARYWIRYYMAKLRLFFSSSGREGLEIINKTLHVDNKLLRDHANEFDGELCLFAVSQEYRKHGIGIMLLEHFHEFMRKNGAESYYLYTDTYCDTKFYDQNGFELISLDTVDFGDEEEGVRLPKYMLYKYNIKNSAGKTGT